MKSESKANLIFLLIFLGIALPGAVILFNKKLDPTVGPMYLPSSVTGQIPYLDPMMDVPGKPRIVPLLTAAWVQGLLQERVPAAAVLLRNGTDGRPLPVMSRDRVFQLVHVAAGEEATRASVLAWNLPRNFRECTTEAAVSSQPESPSTAAVSVERVEIFETTHGVRRDIQESGFPAPPLRVAWITLRFAPGAIGSGTLELRAKTDDGAASDTFPLAVFTP